MTYSDAPPPSGDRPDPGAPPPPYPPPPYHPYLPPRPTNGMALAAMIVSLASMFTCPLVGAVGIYLGNRARGQIAMTGEQGDGMAQAGIIVGWIAIGLSILYVCFVLLVFAVPLSMIPFSWAS